MNEYLLGALVAFLIMGVSVVYFDRRNSKNIEDREAFNREVFRESILAIKSNDVSDYVETMKTEGELPVDESDEFVEIGEIEPEQLLKSIKNE